MEITVFDGESFSVSPFDHALTKADACKMGHSLWVDARLDGPDDPDAPHFLETFDLDPTKALDILAARLDLPFRLTPQDVHGVAWIDDLDGSPAHLVLFHWNEHRLLTVRLGGDAGMLFIRKRVMERIITVGDSPVRLLADTLRLMMITVQRGLTETAVRVGELNEEIVKTVKPNPEQGAELAAYRAVFHTISLRFPSYMVNARAALIDPPHVNGAEADDLGLLESYVKIVDHTQVLIDSVDDSLRHTADALQSQMTFWQGNQVNVLTAMAAVFIPITFITSYFGMNFDWMVGEVNSIAHFMIFGVGLVLLAIIGSIILLRRSGYALSVEEQAGVERARKRSLTRRRRVDSADLSTPSGA